MARHLSFRSGNPALNKNTFKGLQAERSSGPIIRDDNVMTIEGTVNKTALSLMLLLMIFRLLLHILLIYPSLVWVGFGLGVSSILLLLFLKKNYAPDNNTYLLLYVKELATRRYFSYMYAQQFEGNSF